MSDTTGAEPAPHKDWQLRSHGDRETRKEFVAEQYERLWDGVEEKAVKLMEAGERDLSRLHLMMRRNFGDAFSDPHLAQKYRDHEADKLKRGYILDRRLHEIHDMDSRVVTLMTDAIKMRALADGLGPDVRRVAETGAGWGKVLFNLWLFGGPGPRTGPDCEYWALEPTKAGRRVAERIAQGCDSNIPLRTAGFDYYEPDLSCMDKDIPSGFVTHHSIEQIPELPEAFVDALLGVPGFRRCVHLEPVGWQVPGDKWLHGKKPKEMRAIDADNERFAKKRNQNHNLYPMLRRLEQAGRIRIHTCQKHLCSHLLSNATTLIVWGPADEAAQADSIRDDL